MDETAPHVPNRHAVTEEATPPHSPSPVAAPAGPPEPADFEILGELGHGGMGVVYRAYDRNRHEVVALKTMQWVDPAALDRFKKEFRAAADLVHPNLVALHELVCDGRVWFFTMELVEGIDFLNHVRFGRSAEPETTEQEPVTHTLVMGESDAAPPTFDLPGTAALSPPQVERLRAAMGQLVEGVSALHAAGKLHRDIKPSNVLVRPDGRAVLLDFGLAAEMDHSGEHRSTGGLVRGTVAYMSPEQAAGRTLSPASDWYSVGVMLYEALTGRMPHPGRGVFGPLSERIDGPTRPAALAPGTPEDLESLCLDLLREEPAGRPDGAEILRRLGTGATAAAPAATHAPWIGREGHLAFLDERFAAMRRGRTDVVRVHGASGAGKSALVQRFLEGLATRGEAVVLSGRCYERETVPYKALDSLIDDLGRHLRHLPKHEAGALMPRDVLSLARVFPALRAVEAVANAPHRGFDVPDQQELRRRAFAALRELLARLGDRFPLVLSIDDLQWGDADSAAVLAELLRGPDPPVLMLVASHRRENVGSSPFLGALIALSEQADPSVEWNELAVDPLTEAEAAALASALLGGGPGSEERSASIARESAGNPFFVSELVRSVQAGDVKAGTSAAGEVTLDDVIWSRVVRLPAASRRLLEVVAVSGRPVRQSEALACAGLTTADEHAAVPVLRSARLIRSTGPAHAEEVETYHDRVREAVVARLPADALRDHHRALALALEAACGCDPEDLAAHFLGAGDRSKASVYYTEAAAHAGEALAFERAAKLYRLAIELRTPDPEGAGDRSLRRKLGDALANAGRGAEAAAEYLAAAAGATVADAFELRRLAAMQLLVSGHIDEGLDALREVLAAVGMALPATPLGALATLLFNRARLRLRGLSFRRRDPSEIAPADLARIDVCWAAVAGLSVVDFIRGAGFQARGLLLALRAGEPFRIARALAMDAAHCATSGGRSRKRTAALLHHAEALASEVGNPYGRGMVSLSEGTAAYLEGRWRDALGACDRAEETFRDRCTGVAWERATAHAFALWSLTHLGDLAELARRWPVLRKQAGERGDLYEVMNLSTYLMSIVRLADDDPAGARDGLEANMAKWSREGYHVQHNDGLWATAQVELYAGRGAEAWALISGQWPALAGSMLLRVQFIRIAMRHLRARCALAAAGLSDSPGPLLRSVERDARALEREGMPWATAFSHLDRAALLASCGDTAAAVARLSTAEAAFRAADMSLYAASCLRRRGQLLGGAGGDALVSEADACMSAQGVRNPARMTQMYAPGFETATRP